MKKLLTLSSILVLSACSSTSDVQVSTDTYKEDYNTTQTSGVESNTSFNETDLSNTSTSSAPSNTTPTPTSTQTSTPTSSSSSSSSIQAGTYTLQVVAGESTDVLSKAVGQLDIGQPTWQYTKVLNGIRIYTLLYGQYATREAALAAISTLPAEIRANKPFPVAMSSLESTQLN